MAFGPPTPSSYLARLDAHLSRIASAAKRAAILEAEIRRTDRAERALDGWAKGRGQRQRPTPFDFGDLQSIARELSRRLAQVRDEERASTGMQAAE